MGAKIPSENIFQTKICVGRYPLNFDSPLGSCTQYGFSFKVELSRRGF